MEYRERDIKLDFIKKQILTRQENYKIMLPVLLALIVIGAFINIFNAKSPFMSMYVTVIINLVVLAAVIYLSVYLIISDIRSRKDFEQIMQVLYDDNPFELYEYVSDSLLLLKARAKRVRVYRTDNTVTLLPDIGGYKHRLFNKYDFKCDFGRLELTGAKVNEDGTEIITDEIEIKLKKVNGGE